MKKIFLILTITIMTLTMTGCLVNEKKETDNNQTKTTTTSTTTKSTTNEVAVYDKLIEQYTKSLKEKWGGQDLNENEMSLMMLDCYGSDPQKNIGYTLKDLDNDNRKELIFATTNAITDDFYGKLIFDVYSLNEKGKPVKVITSTERNRFYYVGENKFANVGSNSAGEELDTTVSIKNKKLIDLKYSTEKSKYVNLDLTLTK